jgi:hypothetical protein
MGLKRVKYCLLGLLLYVGSLYVYASHSYEMVVTKKDDMIYDGNSGIFLIVTRFMFCFLFALKKTPDFMHNYTVIFFLIFLGS